MDTKLTTTKITPEARRMLRLVAAMTGEKQYRLVERLIKSELERKTREAAMQQKLREVDPA